jgi:hypothetical protein
MYGRPIDLGGVLGQPVSRGASPGRVKLLEELKTVFGAHPEARLASGA